MLHSQKGRKSRMARRGTAERGKNRPVQTASMLKTVQKIVLSKLLFVSAELTNVIHKQQLGKAHKLRNRFSGRANPPPRNNRIIRVKKKFLMLARSAYPPGGDYVIYVPSLRD